jgi:predicted RND superfamily exporter protein
VLNSRLERNQASMVADDYLAIDPQTGEELWRISLRVPGLADIDYGVFVKDIEAQVDQLLAAEQARDIQGIEGALYTGLAPVVYRAQRVLLEGLISSFFWAFVMIAAIMTIVFRDLRAGLFTMLPNVWPVAMVFGMMSWLGIELDIGTMMTAGVAMGVCVDDTVHFANWYRRASELGLSRRDSSLMAYENSAGPIYQSTAIVALGLVIFALSNFMPTQRFGLLMCALLIFGLIADLILTPVMLAGPMGKFFRVGVAPAGAR